MRGRLVKVEDTAEHVFWEKTEEEHWWAGQVTSHPLIMEETRRYIRQM